MIGRIACRLAAILLIWTNRFESWQHSIHLPCVLFIAAGWHVCQVICHDLFIKYASAGIILFSRARQVV